jgi:NTE family protein
VADLVFEGGGVKGIGLAGAYRELSDQGYTPGCVAGTSAGAITAALVAAGYSATELEDLVLNQMHFSAFADRPDLGSELVEFLHKRGLHSGDYFLGWMRERLAAKGVRTFGDLRDPDADPGDETRRYKLQVIASDLSARAMLVLPRDAPRLGFDPDSLEVARAVRMSMSIPVFFDPVSIGSHLIVDGALLSNFPVWLFDCTTGPPRFPTFGLLLVDPHQEDPLVPVRGDASVVPIGSDLDYVKAMVETMLEAHDRFYVEQAQYARTIPIPTLGVGLTEFNIPPERARDLFDSGVKAAREFLATWDFDAYIARFRTGPPPSRRASTR